MKGLQIPLIVVCCQVLYSLLVVEIIQTNIAHCDLLPGIQLAIGGRDARWGGEESEATTCTCQSTGDEHHKMLKMTTDEVESCNDSIFSA